MANTHTPGSFNPSLFTQSIDKVVGEYRAAWRKGKPGSIGAVEQAEQYARLIAAAPRMLELLRQIATMSYSVIDMANDAKAILRDVEGKSNGRKCSQIRPACSRYASRKSGDGRDAERSVIH